MPEGMCLYVANNSTDPAEPLLVYLPYRSRADQYSGDRRQPITHRTGFRELTSVRVSLKKTASYSKPLSDIEALCGIHLIRGDEHLIELGFDGETKGESADFCPLLPLIMRW
jgi:hypothetical protein